MKAVVGDRCWGQVKRKINSFGADYSKIFSLNRLAAQRAIEDNVNLSF